MLYLRYLRRPAALKTVSSETLGSLFSAIFLWNRKHKFLFGKTAWFGNSSWGNSSLIASRARSNAGEVILLVPVLFAACSVISRRPVLHRTFVTSSRKSSVHSSSQGPGGRKPLSRRTIH